MTSSPALRRGWTTGACAAAAAKSAFNALVSEIFLDPVEITLPGGQCPSFALAVEARGAGWARAGIVKDAGDDPDVTHEALIIATVRWLEPGSGVRFRAGPGVGTVTRPGLLLAVGEPAINPKPREMIQAALQDVNAPRAGAAGAPLATDSVDVEVEIAIENGEEIARKTLNARLGIIGGLSVLGTTGIVIPYSCSAWIHSIHRGIDVARAAGLTHLAGSTGSTSEAAVALRYALPEIALIDMGDFVGGTLKYVRKHPVERFTIAGGFAKMSKLAQGRLDLHSRHGMVDLTWLAGEVEALGGCADTVGDIAAMDSAAQALARCDDEHIPIAQHIAAKALDVTRRVIAPSAVALDIAIFDREGQFLAAQT